MPPTPLALLKQARTWFNLSLFNSPRAGDYFEYLLQGIDPAWSAIECRARVEQVIPETADTQTWVLRPNRRFRGFQAGQHVHLGLDINGVRHTRTFTLSSTPEEWARHGTIRLTVKKVPGGRITPWMHDHLTPGSLISLSPASGHFLLPAAAARRLGYIAAGSGITPVASHLQSLADRHESTSATLLYFARSSRDFILEGALRTLEKTLPRLKLHLIPAEGNVPARSTLPTGLISAAHVQALLKGKPERVYLCGPHPFREQAKHLLAEAGYPANQIHEEAFGLPPAPRREGEPVTVTFHRSQTETRTDQPGTLLELAEQAGLKPASGCRIGICHTCKCTKTAGQVRNLLTGELSSNGQEDIQICITTPVSNVELAL